MKHQWMPMFWGDFFANTLHLSAQDIGAYVLLIAHAWEHNGCIIHAHAQRIARTDNRNWQKTWKKLECFFELVADNERQTPRYMHPRVVKELAIAAEMSSKRKGAAMQMHANRRARAEQVHTPHPTSQKKNSSKRNSLLGENDEKAPARSLTLDARVRSPASEWNREPDPFVIDEEEYARRLNPPPNAKQITRLP